MVDTDPAYLLSVRKLNLAVRVRSHTHTCPPIVLSPGQTVKSSPASLWLSFFFNLIFVFSFFLSPTSPLLLTRLSLPLILSSISVSLSSSLSLSLSSRCQASFYCMLYMHSLSMPPKIQQDSLISLSGGVTKKNRRQKNKILLYQAQ